MNWLFGPRRVAEPMWTVSTTADHFRCDVRERPPLTTPSSPHRPHAQETYSGRRCLTSHAVSIPHILWMNPILGGTHRQPQREQRRSGRTVIRDPESGTGTRSPNARRAPSLVATEAISARRERRRPIATGIFGIGERPAVLLHAARRRPMRLAGPCRRVGNWRRSPGRSQRR